MDMDMVDMDMVDMDLPDLFDLPTSPTRATWHIRPSWRKGSFAIFVNGFTMRSFAQWHGHRDREKVGRSKFSCSWKPTTTTTTGEIPWSNQNDILYGMSIKESNVWYFENLILGGRRVGWKSDQGWLTAPCSKRPIREKEGWKEAKSTLHLLSTTSQVENLKKTPFISLKKISKQQRSV